MSIVHSSESSGMGAEQFDLSGLHWTWQEYLGGVQAYSHQIRQIRTVTPVCGYVNSIPRNGTPN